MEARLSKKSLAGWGKILFCVGLLSFFSVTCAEEDDYLSKLLSEQHESAIIELATQEPAALKKLVPGLIQALESSEETILLRAIHSLEKIGPLASEAESALLKILHTKNETLQNAASNALDQIIASLDSELKEKKKNEKLEKLFIELLSAQHRRVALNKLEAFGIEQKRKIIPHLMESALLPNTEIALSSLSLLYQISKEECAEEEEHPLSKRKLAHILMDGLKHKKGDVRFRVLILLACLKIEELRVARKAIKEVAEKDEHYEIRNLANKLMSKLVYSFSDETSEKILERLLSWENSYLLSQLYSLDSERKKELASLLCKTLKEDNWYLKLCALRSLKAIGKEGKVALPKLAKLLRDKNEVIRLEAARLRTILMDPLEDCSSKKIAKLLLAKKTSWLISEIPKLTVELQGKLLPYLEKAVKEENKNIRSQVLQILGKLKPALKEQILPLLALILEDGDYYIREEAVALRGVLYGPLEENPHTIIVERLLSSENRRIKKELYYLNTGDKKQVALLLAKELESFEDSLRFNRALDALKEIAFAAEFALPIITKIAIKHENKLAREKALRLKYRILGPLVIHHFDMILKRILSEEFPLVEEEIADLDKDKKTLLVQPLIEALKSKNNLIQLRAIKSLKKLGKLANEAIPPLDKLSFSRDKEIRAAAEKTVTYLKRLREIWDDVKIVCLNEAIKKGLVAAKGVNPKSYREIELQIVNLSPKKISIDIAGSYIEPSGRKTCQRLGLGPTVLPEDSIQTGEGRALVQFLPKEKRKFKVQTCCLDAGRSAPSRQQFKASFKELPKVRETVMRWWVDHPQVPQGAVNSAIWQYRDTVRYSSVDQRGRNTRPTWDGERFVDTPAPNTVKIRAKLYNDTYYQLTNLELSAVEEDGHRFLGTELLQVIPEEEATYAVALGEDYKIELWRMAMTGENPWSFVLNLDSGEQIYRVIPGLIGEYLFVTESGIKLFDRITKKFSYVLKAKEENDLTFQQRNRYNFNIIMYYPTKKFNEYGGDQRTRSAYVELWSFDLVRKQLKLIKTFWNISFGMAGNAGIYALSHRKVLKKYNGKTFKNLAQKVKFKTIVAVGSRVIWMTTKKDRLVGVSAKNGKIFCQTKLNGNKVKSFSLDPITDDLALILDDKFIKVNAKDGKIVQLPALGD